MVIDRNMDSHRNETPKAPLRAQDLPADEPLGELEPVAYFNGAMPTGVTAWAYLCQLSEVGRQGPIHSLRNTRRRGSSLP